MLNFHHLTVFETLLKTRSVTLASEELDLPQATLSRHLQFLRDHFGDRLFVRTRSGMEPTPAAQAATPAVIEALRIYRDQLRGGGEFAADVSRRNFRIAASDVGHLLVLPAMERVLAEEAPHVRLTAAPLGRAKLISQLESGDVDVAIGSFPDLFAGVRERTLFQEHYVCVVPAGGTPLTLDRFRAARHVIVDGRHLGHVHQEVERMIADLVGGDAVRITTQSFLLGAHLAEETGLVLTVPSRVARLVARGRMTFAPPPVDLPGFDVKMYWHERFDHDAGNTWLRNAMARARPGGCDRPPC